jgi:acyl-CoA synthetase (AMP-forming)/AMP-acid ligase II
MVTGGRGPSGGQPKTYSHIATLLEAIADRLPTRLALAHGSDGRTWAEFDDRAARLASVLTAAGISPGATVAVDLYNCPEYLETFYAALKIRAVPANVNYRYVSDELRQLLDNADAEALVVHASLAAGVLAVRDLLPRLRLILQVDDRGAPDGSHCPDGVVDYESALREAQPAPRVERSPEDHYLSFTGGTTGLPKGVMYHLGRSTEGALGLRDQFLGRTPAPEEDPVQVAVDLADSASAPVAVPASPLMHSAGLIYASIPTLSAGGTVVTLTGRSFDPSELLRTIERWRVTLLAIVGDAFARPLVHALEAASEADTTSLRVICSAGAAWSASVKRRLMELMPDVTLYDSCGSTEGVTYGRRRVSEPSAVATANFDAAPGLLVLGPEMQLLPPGETGLLAGPTNCDGYYKDPERSARVFFHRNGSSYAVPGDYGRIEPDGTVSLIGRGTSTINTGGEKVHAEEVEQVLGALEGVEGSIVVGIPDERFGQVVAAVVEIRAGGTIDENALRDEARKKLAGYKIPRRVAFVGQLPRLPNGKADYPAVRSILEGSPTPAG